MKILVISLSLIKQILQIDIQVKKAQMKITNVIHLLLHIQVEQVFQHIILLLTKHLKLNIQNVKTWQNLMMMAIL